MSDEKNEKTVRLLTVSLSVEELPDEDPLAKKIKESGAVRSVRLNCQAVGLEDIHDSWVALAAFIAKFVPENASHAAKIVHAVARMAGAQADVANATIIPAGQGNN